MTCGAQRRKPDHQGVSWTVASNPISNTLCPQPELESWHAAAWPQFSQAHYKAAFSIDTDIMSRGSMQQLLINGLDPKICSQKVNVFLICQGTSLRCPGGSQGLSNEICQIVRPRESGSFLVISTSQQHPARTLSKYSTHSTMGREPGQRPSARDRLEALQGLQSLHKLAIVH